MTDLVAAAVSCRMASLDVFSERSLYALRDSVRAYESYLGRSAGDLIVPVVFNIGQSDRAAERLEALVRDTDLLEGECPKRAWAMTHRMLAHLIDLGDEESVERSGLRRPVCTKFVGAGAFDGFLFDLSVDQLDMFGQGYGPRDSDMLIRSMSKF